MTLGRDVAGRVASAIGRDRLIEEPDLGLGGLPVGAVAAPESRTELAELLRMAWSERWAVIPIGLGTWLDAGNPVERADLVISLRRLDRVLECEPADLVASVQAGMRLDRLADLLSDHRVRWPLDPPGGGTVGATIATASAGPLATGYGTPRDLVLGLEVLRADGVLLRTGGRVVKNVTGYNLVRLFTGSWGTLGVIVAAHLRLHPRPLGDETRVFFAEDPGPLIELVSTLGDGRALLPVAAELIAPAAGGALGIEASEWQAAIRWSGHPEAVEAAISLAEEWASQRGIRAEPRSGIWEKLTDLEAATRAVLTARVSVPIQATQAIIGLTRSFAGGQTPALVAAPLLGRVRILVSRRLYDSVQGPRIWALRLDDLRRTAAEWGGNARLERAPDDLKTRVNAWGDTGPTAELHTRLKDRFDAKGILNPGRFVRKGGSG